MPAALPYILQFLNMLPQLIATGQNVMGLVNSTTTAVQNMIAEKRDPTQAEWDALNAITNNLRAQLHAPATPGVTS